VILYLDTSALVKLFVVEPASELVAEFTEGSDTVVTSRIAYVEACSALARRRREKLLDAAAHLRAQKALLERWDDLVTVELDEIDAGDLTSRHDLRAFDAVHLAAALKVRAYSNDVPFQFCSFDGRQRIAAAAENLVVIPAPESVR
jgi:predicted nucleic acid-binding protein